MTLKKLKIASAALLIACSSTLFQSCLDESSQNYDYDDSEMIGGVTEDADTEEASKEEGQTVVTDDLFQLTVPDYISKTTQLNDDAALQYMNEYREFYVMVMYEPKSDVADLLEPFKTNETDTDVIAYSNIMIMSYKQSLTNPVEFTPIDTTINGLNARIIEMTASYSMLPVHYYIVTYESEKYFYQLYTWTLESKTDSNLEDMRKILDTMKELEGASASESVEPMEEEDQESME